jgi:hypothetical protein
MCLALVQPLSEDVESQDPPRNLSKPETFV